MLAVGGVALNSIDNMQESSLGWAETVREETLGEDKYTFVEGCRNPKSCTILLKGPDQHTIDQLKDAVRDGLRAVANAIEDKCVVPGAGSFEIYLNHKLIESENDVVGKAQLGYKAFADAVLVIPKTLAQNSGFDMHEALLLLKQDFAKHKALVGLNINELGLISPIKEGVFDNYCVKKIFLSITTTLVEQLLLCDEIIKAGKQMGGDRGEQNAAPKPVM